MLILIDAGHGGSDTGTITPLSTAEKDVTLAVSKKIHEKLSGYGVSSQLVRDEDRYIPLSARADAANRTDADYYVAIHTGTSSNPAMRGNVSYVYKMGDAAEAMARSISHQMRKAGIRDRGIGYSDNALLDMLSMPALWLEIAYLTNTDDEKLLNDEVFTDRIAQAIADGIIRYLGVPDEEETDVQTDARDSYQEEDNVNMEENVPVSTEEYVTVQYFNDAIKSIKEYIDYKMQ